MKIGVSLPADLVEFADEAAGRRGTSRSQLLAELLEAERVRQRTREYLDRHGWDVVDDKPSVANVYDIQKVIRSDFVERLGTLPPVRLAALADGLRLVLDLG